jgi:hypothetical protein
MAFDNLAIAQHRDTLRYAHTRSGEFLSKLKRFEAGDLVYLRRQPANSMDPRSGRIILRVKKVLGTGRLLPRRSQYKDHQRARGELRSVPQPQHRLVAESSLGRPRN